MQTGNTLGQRAVDRSRDKCACESGDKSVSTARTCDYIRTEQRRFRRAQSGKMWQVRQLLSFYYLNNFKRFIANGHKHNFDLLGKDELEFLTQFDAFPMRHNAPMSAWPTAGDMSSKRTSSAMRKLTIFRINGPYSETQDSPKQSAVPCSVTG